MDIDIIIQNLTVFVQDNMIVAVIIGALILYLLFRRPKILLTIIFFLLVAYGVAWLFEVLAEKGLG